MDFEKLAKIYGKWPSFVYLCLATIGPVLAFAAVLALR